MINEFGWRCSCSYFVRQIELWSTWENRCKRDSDDGWNMRRWFGENGNYVWRAVPSHIIKRFIHSRFYLSPVSRTWRLWECLELWEFFTWNWALRHWENSFWVPQKLQKFFSNVLKDRWGFMWSSRNQIRFGNLEFLFFIREKSDET